MRNFHSTKEFKRVIAIGDIHGQLALMLHMLKLINFTQDDLLIFMGDYVDRGTFNDEVVVVKTLLKMKNEYPNNIVLLKGNHEVMLEYDIIRDTPKAKSFRFGQNGGNYEWMQEEYKTLAVELFRVTKIYHETENHIFVHAGATEYALDTQDLDVLLWERNGNQFKCFDKKLVVGHTIGSEIVVNSNKICVDTGAYYYGVLSAYDVKNDKSFQSRKPTVTDKRL